jgi:hypothetical protein
MDKRQISAVLVLDALGIPAALSSFDQRLTVQKAIYLVQESGLDLGYFFQWYIRGPYCSSVARDLFPVIEDEPSARAAALAGWSLEPGSKTKLASLKGLLVPPTAWADSLSEVVRARWLELLASVHYLVNRGQVENDAKKVSDKLKAFNKNFSDAEVREAIRVLTGFRLLKAV